MSGDKTELIDSLFDNNKIKPVIIDEYIDIFERENKTSEDTVEAVFRQFPDNNDLSQVLAKVIILNNRYSARLTDWSPSKNNVDVVSMAEHIIQINKNNHAIDECFDKDKAVKIIKKVSELKARDTEKKMGEAVHTESRHYNAPSFASKYCSWTWMVRKTIDMPILDGYVAGMLYHIYKFEKIKKIEPFTESFGQEKIKKDYGIFYKVYTDFVDKYLSDTKLNNKQIDEFLWQYAKSNDSGLRI